MKYLCLEHGKLKPILYEEGCILLLPFAKQGLSGEKICKKVKLGED